MLVNLLGRKWELTFTTLVTFGGAFFASFPLFYSTSFGGAYWLWMLILFCFVLQAVSYEFRTKPSNVLGRRTFEGFLVVNGLLGTILLGMAVAMFFNGAPFSVSSMHFSRWESPWHGLEVLTQLLPWLLGLAVFSLSRVLALLYFAGSVDEVSIVSRVRKRIWVEGGWFLLFFCGFLGVLLFKGGYEYHPDSRIVTVVPAKYLHNFIAMPVLSGMLVVGVLLWLTGWIRAMLGRTSKAFWFCAAGAFLAVLSLLTAAGFHNTCYLPSTSDMQDSLTIQNSSASHYSLAVMSVVSLLIPFVAAYIVWAWSSLSRHKISSEELDGEAHKY